MLLYSFLSYCVVEHWSSVAQGGPHTWSLSSSGTTRLKNGESKHFFFLVDWSFINKCCLDSCKVEKVVIFYSSCHKKNSSTDPNIWIKCCCFMTTVSHLCLCVFAIQSIWQHPGGGGKGCRECEESAAAASAAAQLHPRRVLPAIYQRGAGELHF